MTDAITALHAAIRDLREMTAEINSALTDLDNEVSSLARRMTVGIGMSDRCATIQGGDIDIDGDGFAVMRPDDGDPENGQHP